MTQKKKKRNNSNRKWFLRITLIWLICVCLAIVSYFVVAIGSHEYLAQFAGTNSGCGTEDPAPFEGYAHVTLPDDYSNFSSSCAGIQGMVATASFDIDPKDFEVFLSTSSIDPSSLSNQLPLDIHTTWIIDIKDFDTVRYGIYESDEWLEEIIVDTNDPNRWTVYFTVLAG